MKTVYLSWGMIAMLTLFIACTPSSNQTSADSSAESAALSARSVAPPIPGEEVAFQRFTIDPTQTETIDLNNGSRITISANSLLDAQGNPIQGELNIFYREFHDVVDVLFSGIPMDMMNGEKRGIFQTAGMMEIRAEQNQQTLKVNPQKPIKVELASYRFAEGKSKIDTKGYAQYYLDQTEGEWQEVQAVDLPVPNIKRARLIKGVPAVPANPSKPKKASNPNEVFNFTVDYSKFPSLAGFKDILWEYAKIEEVGTVNPNKETWVFAQAWTDVKISARKGSKEVYYIDLSRPNKNARIIVKPVVAARDFEAAMKVYRDMTARNAQLRQQRNAALANAKNQSEMLSILTVNNFGIYNIDRLFKQLSSKVVQAQVAYAEFEVKDKYPIVYHVIPDLNALIPYAHGPTSLHWFNNEFRYFPNENNFLVAFYQGRLYSFDREQFAKQGKLIGDKFTFELQDQGPAEPKTLKALIRS